MQCCVWFGRSATPTNPFFTFSPFLLSSLFSPVLTISTFLIFSTTFQHFPHYLSYLSTNFSTFPPFNSLPIVQPLSPFNFLLSCHLSFHQLFQLFHNFNLSSNFSTYLSTYYNFLTTFSTFPQS